MSRSVRWEYVVGLQPHRVTAFEDTARGGVVTLRWQEGQKPHRRRVLRSLGFTVRGARGGFDRAQVARAERAAAEQYAALLAGRVVVTVATSPRRPLTIAEGWALAKDPELGKWNKDTPHRKDLQRAIDRAIDIWGPTMTWDEVDRGQLRKLWRRELARLRAAGHGGVRGAELTLDLVLAVGAWLRDEQRIAPTAALRWKQMDSEFADDAGEHVPAQPRYTVEEYRKLFAAAWKADERYGLAYALGAEYRLGQVVRARRSDLQREAGRLRVPGRGKKRGVVVVLTPGQRGALERVLTVGYLAGLEAAYRANEIADYPLFPGGQFTTRDGQLISRAAYAERPHLDRSALRTWHLEAERLAEIPHVPGRGPYGSRRAGVDAAKAAKISREGLEAHGGWADSQMPDTVYADADADYAREEAAEVRAKIRGESSADDAPTTAAVAPESSQIVAPIDASSDRSHSPES